MRRVLRASLLILALGCPTLAGDMTCPPGSSQPLTNGTPEVTEAETQNEASDSLTETVLALLEGVLAIF